MSSQSPNRKYGQRPPRLQLFPDVEPLYFITFNTFPRRKILATEELHQAFVQHCRRAADFRISVGRYVIMPDHVHLFTYFGHAHLDVGPWVGGLKSALGKVLTRQGIARPYWQEGHFDRVLRSDQSYDQKWEYVRHNPVRAGLSEAPESWPFSGEIMDLPFH